MAEVISLEFNYWVSYGLFPAVNENITINLRDVDENNLIDSDNVANRRSMSK